eukprot:13615298-Ditylum_brightwellii.AAC.1
MVESGVFLGVSVPDGRVEHALIIVGCFAGFYILEPNSGSGRVGGDGIGGGLESDTDGEASIASMSSVFQKKSGDAMIALLVPKSNLSEIRS